MAEEAQDAEPLIAQGGYAAPEQVYEDTIDVNSLKLMFAAGCCNTGLYPVWPHYCGWNVRQEFCCLINQTCIMPGPEAYLCHCGEQKSPGDLCQIGLFVCSIGLKKPTACYRGKWECFGLVGNGEFPVNPQNPVACACCGVALHPNTGFMLPLRVVAPLRERMD
mmetsp:Transcript_26708/g.52636  ORF Transcript_26708/g.52636 Transcript_26708/m.52636 type:complete len:164 (-) Transcript_26708:229-720(-)|eukprot:CAMPEP_0175142784 /NCGR_PEP_ID=MMETSP0087-20121206/13019_1 /TAXON_ID=136419 /ORGANISM="Unknown Unknown, Strain D1" /LENGTH=163 /DNA_ID=CAMNT_0016426681 /DNA_START=55 /DNA_END=546 /DNA_ORIENTATION=-